MKIDRETDALIVVDMQNDFADPKGALYVEGGWRLMAPINNLLPQFDTVAFTQDWHPINHSSFGYNGGPWPQHCVQGSWGAQIIHELNTDYAHLIIRKGTDRDADSYSAFRGNPNSKGQRKETGLAGFLFDRRIKKTYIVGLARDYCVKWTALDAGGLNPHVIWDLTKAVNPADDDAVRQELLGNFVKIV